MLQALSGRREDSTSGSPKPPARSCVYARPPPQMRHPSTTRGRHVSKRVKRGTLEAGVSRRGLLKAGASTAALLAAVKTSFVAGIHGAAAAGPETTRAKLGFIALTDAGPLFVAKDKGFFAKHGMPDVEVQKQASWGTTRDNLVLGSDANGIDGAHIL